MILVIFLGAVIGVYSPEAAPYLGPVPMYSLMVSLYISFMPLQPEDLIGIARHNAAGIVWFIATRQFLLPSATYGLFLLIDPDYALAALLLSGAATAVTAPFIAYLLGADIAFTTILTVTSSFILPFSLPMIVLFWVGKKIDISAIDMMLTLIRMVLIPAVAVFITRRFLPRLARKVQQQGYFWGLATMFLSIMAIFSRYSDFFFSTPEIVWEGLLVATGVALFTGALTWLLALWCSPAVRLTFVISTVLLNLVLIVVLGSEFFGPREAITAVMYTVPFYALVVPLRIWIVSVDKKKTLQH